MDQTFPRHEEDKYLLYGNNSLDYMQETSVGRLPEQVFFDDLKVTLTIINPAIFKTKQKQTNPENTPLSGII